MPIESLAHFIQQSIPQIRFSAAALDRICNAFEQYDLNEKEFLLKEGKIGGYYFLEEGFLRNFIYDSKGNEITITFYKAQRVIFDPSSFFFSMPSTENMQALTKCVGYFSTFEKLNDLFHSTPEFREFARAMIAKEFVSFKSETISKINKTAEERYADLMIRNKEIFQVAQLKQIASYLGITDTSLSRIRRDFSYKTKN
jgi:CRP-like cAMP-binding protein